MRIENFKSRMANRDMMAGTFLKTPAYELVEVLATSELDFICIDMEHSPFDRARTDACLAVARALDFPVLVRVTHFAPQTVLQVLDMGAVGVVAPHIITAEQAKDLVRAAHFGPGGPRFCWRHALGRIWQAKYGGSVGAIGTSNCCDCPD